MCIVVNILRKTAQEVAVTDGAAIESYGTGEVVPACVHANDKDFKRLLSILQRYFLG